MTEKPDYLKDQPFVLPLIAQCDTCDDFERVLNNARVTFTNKNVYF